MSTDYVGDPSAEHGVPKPSLSNFVQIKTLVDLLDPLNASAIHGGSVTVLADWVEFFRQHLNTSAGVRRWDASTLYQMGWLAFDGNTSRTYRALINNSNTRPSENGQYWAQCDFSIDEIQASSAKYTSGSGAAGITCTRGASVVTAHMVNTENTLRQIMLVIQGVPLDNSIEVDLSGSAIRFLSLFHGGVVSPRSSGWQYAPRVGLNPPATGHDVFTVYAAKDIGDSATACTVSIQLWGV